MIYIDTSVLVAYYCPEPLSPQAERLLRSAVRPSISDLTEVEFASAVRRKVLGGKLNNRQAAKILAQFAAHAAADLYTRLPLERHHFRLAGDLISRLSLPLRALDALHLSVASAGALELVTADKPLSESAARAGVRATLLRVR